MPRGGKRPGAGRRFYWKKGKTVPIRVPEAIADRVLQFAHALDKDEIEWSLEQGVKVTNLTRKVELSRTINIYKLKGKEVIQLSELTGFLQDLVRST